MAPKPIIRPGPTAAGPPGWEERQQERLSSVNTQSSNGETGTSSHERTSSTQSGGMGGRGEVIDGIERDEKGVPIIDSKTGEFSHQPVEYQEEPSDHANVSLAGKIKNKVHKVGEKLAFVPPRDAEAGVSTQVSKSIIIMTFDSSICSQIIIFPLIECFHNA